MNTIKSSPSTSATAPPRSLFLGCGLLAAAGLGAFVAGSLGEHPERAWQTFLINFLLWSAIAQGAVLFSAVTHVVKARWTGPLSGLSEAFAGFFPLSFVLFLILFLGREYIFPWLGEDLHGQETWLNIPFLFTRDAAGLLMLYGCGTAYLGQALKLRRMGAAQDESDPDRIRGRMTVWAGLYCFLFAVVLSLIGFDLVMSMDPHWISTLFGGYHFVKAFYLGLGALIILAAIVHLRRGERSSLTSDQFHDVGKLFFAFCLLWADFFYVQLNVIWYGNIPEETHYVILRTMLPPWRWVAWTVFIVCFLIPFCVLLNKRIKTLPRFMIMLCALVILGMWLEHLLLLGPALSVKAAEVPLGFTDGLVFIGFLGLMGLALAGTFKAFPELLPPLRAETAEP